MTRNKSPVVKLYKNYQKFSVEITKNYLTDSRKVDILFKLVCNNIGVLCEETGDCSNDEVTSVEYVRCRPGRHAIGRLKPILFTRISRGRGIGPAEMPVCFSDAA